MCVTSAVDISKVRTRWCKRLWFLVPTSKSVSSKDVLTCRQVHLEAQLNKTRHAFLKSGNQCPFTRIPIHYLQKTSTCYAIQCELATQPLNKPQINTIQYMHMNLHHLHTHRRHDRKSLAFNLTRKAEHEHVRGVLKN